MNHSTIRLIFTRQRTVASALIRAFTWSAWSHVAIVVGDRVIESALGEGVREVSLATLKRTASRFEFLDIPCAQADQVVAAAHTQLGKPYDLSAILGLLSRSDWQVDDAWFCSELIAWAFAQAGVPLFRDDHLHRITPEHLWMLAPRSEEASRSCSTMP